VTGKNISGPDVERVAIQLTVDTYGK